MSDEFEKEDYPVIEGITEEDLEEWGAIALDDLKISSLTILDNGELVHSYEFDEPVSYEDSQAIIEAARDTKAEAEAEKDKEAYQGDDATDKTEDMPEDDQATADESTE